MKRDRSGHWWGFPILLVESMIWRDRNLKFGPNYDLEVIKEKLKIWRGKAG